MPGIQEIAVRGLEEIARFPSEPEPEINGELRQVLDYPFNYRTIFSLGPQLNINPEAVPASYNEQMTNCRALGLCSAAFSMDAAALIQNTGLSRPERAKQFSLLKSLAHSNIEDGYLSILRNILQLP